MIGIVIKTIEIFLRVIEHLLSEKKAANWEAYQVNSDQNKNKKTVH